MLIGIDARMLGPQCGGLGRYIEQLVLELERMAAAHQFLLFMGKENWRNYEPKTSNVKKIFTPIPWYGWREQILLKKIIQQTQVDIMHFPHWNVPFFYNNPYIVTIHDLIMWHFPREEASTLGPAAYWIKDTASRLVVKHAATAARQILTTSEFTKHDIHETLGTPLPKLTVTYQAPFFFERQDKGGNKQASLNRFAIAKPYVLYVGNCYPHKNLDSLLIAWKLFQEIHGGGYQLVLVGKKNYFYEKLLPKIQAIKNVVYTGFLEDNELEAMYAGAALYVAPSLYEGFALPALEAMARGVPVTASSRSCFPEVLGEAAVYFDPENIPQLAQVIFQVLTDQNIRHELRLKGQAELTRYSGERLARQTLAVYESVLG